MWVCPTTAPITGTVTPPGARKTGEKTTIAMNFAIVLIPVEMTALRWSGTALSTAITVGPDPHNAIIEDLAYRSAYPECTAQSHEQLE